MGHSRRRTEENAGSAISPQLRVLVVFLFSALLTIGLTTSIFIYKTHQGDSPLVIAAAGLSFSIYPFSITGKDSFLNLMSRIDRERESENAADQIDFVAEIAASRRLEPDDAKALAQSIVFHSREANYDPFFVAAVIKSESAFRPKAQSPVGALGLMQILPNTGKFIARLENIEWKGVAKLTDPDYNLKLGIAYLKYLEERFRGNRRHVLIAYNWGPNNLAQVLSGEVSRNNIPRSTLTYTSTILADHSDWKADYNVRQISQMQAHADRPDGSA